MRFPRDILDRVRAAARHFPAVVLTGARQTGKTTLLREAFPDHAYVSLDLPSEAASAENDPVAFLARHPSPVLVDEVQYAPGLFRHLKVVIDSERRAGRFILTGSQKFTLMQGVSESLAGRAAVLDLEALSAHELSTHSTSARRLRDVPATLARGFLPALWERPTMSSDEYLGSYVATCLERDVRQIVNVADLRTFERFLRLCAVRSGQVLNRTDLARDAGVAPRTAVHWLSALEASNQVTLLPPYFANLSKRLVKSPKLFFNDPGMLMFLLGLDAEALATSPSAGAVWETAVFAEVRKIVGRHAKRREVFFYREHDGGGEVDFVLTGSGHVDLLECKWTELPTSRDAAGLRRVAAVLSGDALQPVRAQYLACRAPNPFPLTPEVTAVHGFALDDHLSPGRRAVSPD